jgi:homopolymeric O-antigen transport system ATP-binding protein
MSNTVIVAENLSKSYIVGHRSAQRERYTALRDVIAREARNFARKSIDLFRGRQIVQGDELEEFWALRDVSFEVRQGEVLAIIGRNGAGKSTLLKVLSRITEPSCGRAILRGRVASLLEVGTGFHPELTGRENIFLNGAILGMKRAEIKAKFDAIVAFAEVERFLDTPVKRYSSGMYVRLAFAVAAHLDPEILIIDEVLAVGDAEFQKKCLGKIGDVARGGRTVLFVSHNMAAVKSLTTRGILLDQGSLKFSGTSEQVIAHYAQMTSRAADTTNRNWGKGKHTAIRDVRLLDKDNQPTTQYIPGEPLRVDVIVETDGTPGMALDLFLVDATRTRLGMASISQFHGLLFPQKKGTYQVNLNLSPLWLASGNYWFDVATALHNVEWDHFVESAIAFDVQFSNPLGFPFDFNQSYGYGNLALLAQPEPELVSI